MIEKFWSEVSERLADLYVCSGLIVKKQKAEQDVDEGPRNVRSTTYDDSDSD